jgi:hypothetical protein
MENGKKIVVIDGLARSGTTLLSSIIHSQKRMACYRGVFHEALATKLGEWPHGLVRHPVIPESYKLSLCEGTDNRYYSCFQKFTSIRKIYYFISRVKTQLKKSVRLDYDLLKENTLKSICADGQFDRLTMREWKNVLERKLANINGLDALYQQLAGKFDIDVLAFRWNQGMPYVHKWLRNPNHYWVAVIRNPLDRALSAHKSHRWNIEDSIENTEKYITGLENTHWCKNLYIVYYEDLVKKPYEVFQELCEFLGIKIDVSLDTLYGQDGSSYRSESSRLVERGKSHKEGEAYSGIYTKSINRYLTEFDDVTIARFKDRLQEHQLLARYF